MQRLTFNSAQNAISHLCRDHKLKFSNKPTRKSVFLDNETSARFFGESWEDVLAQVTEFVRTQPQEEPSI